MLKMQLAAGLAAAALMAGAALAQTSTTAPAAGTTTAPAAPPQASSTAPAASQMAASGQIMTQMPADQFRASKLMGVDVYGSDNQKIGDIDEILIDKQGKIHGVVVGVGGFLGIGQKDVAIPYDQVQWMTSREVQAQNQQSTNQAGTGATTTTGGVSAPTAPATTGTVAPAPMGATNASSGGTEDSTPARAMVKMTKADLQSAPEFRYSSAANPANTAPPATTNRP